MSRLWSGQGGMLTRQMVNNPEHFPHDRWIVNSTLEIFRRQDPDLAYILMAQTDDAAHCIGCGWDPLSLSCPGIRLTWPKGVR